MIIERPVEEVWDFISNISQLDQWITASTSTTPISTGPIQAGWQFESRYRYGNITNVFRYQVMAHTPPRHLAFRAIKGKFPSIRNIELLPDGSWTRMTNTLEAGAPANGIKQIIIGIMSPILRLLMRQQLKKEIRIVKSRLESVTWST